jgi:competence protein ComGC
MNPMRRNAAAGQTRRAGYTLAEMVAVTFLISVLLPMSVGLLQKAWRVQGESRQAFYLSIVELRLADRFRVDSHAATEAVAAESGLVLRMPDGMRIQYTPSGDRIERRASRGDRLLHRETFPLGTNRHASFVACDQDPAPRLRLQIADSDAPETIRLRVEAVVGLNAQGAPGTRGGDE